jgi:hypothetical protein
VQICKVLKQSSRDEFIYECSGCKISENMSGDSGWNAVIHHPSELELQNWDWDGHDGEPERELPSTVDMDAIKDGGNWNPVTGMTII